MNKLLACLSAVGLFAAAQTVRADTLTYNNFDVGYKYTNVDVSGVDDGHGVEANITFSPIAHFFLEGGYEYINIDNAGEGHAYAYGIGGYVPLEENLHLVGSLGGLRVDTESEGGGDANDDGYYLGAKVRYDICSGTELEAGATYVDFSDSQTSWVYELAALFPVAEHLKLQGQVELNDDDDVALVAGVRIEL